MALGAPAAPALTRAFVVSEGGLEPPRPCGHQPLKLARLPIPPLRLEGSLYRRYLTPEPEVSQTREASKVPSALTTRPLTREESTECVSTWKRGMTGTCSRM